MVLEVKSLFHFVHQNINLFHALVNRVYIDSIVFSSLEIWSIISVDLSLNSSNMALLKVFSLFSTTFLFTFVLVESFVSFGIFFDFTLFSFLLIFSKLSMYF